MKLSLPPRPFATLLALAPLACGDDVAPVMDTETESGSTSGTPDPGTTSSDPTPTDTGPDPDSGSTGTTGPDPGTTEDPDGSSSGPPLPPPMEADFVVTIENISNTGLMFSPISPGLWANHEAGADVFFELGQPDDDEGLEDLAEIGNPLDLEQAVAAHAGVDQVGVFDTPVGAQSPGPLLPGDVYEFTFTAQPFTRLSLAAMVVGSNDHFIATSPVGLNLFAGGGQVIGERDVSANLRIYDAGTEINQAPGQGPLQALHLPNDPLAGPSEGPGAVRPFNHSLHAIALGPDLIQIDVDDDPEAPGTFIVTLTNISADRGTMVTPFSSLVWATHTDQIALFEDGAAASPELESLAEDGDASGLEGVLMGSAEVGEVAVIPGPIAPGDAVQFSLTPDPLFPRLSLATMVVHSNDAFLAAGPDGIALYDDNGGLHDNGDIEDQMIATVTPWDAGTEANQVPGAGSNQVLNQGGMANIGPADPIPTVRRYADETTEFQFAQPGGFVDVQVQEAGGVYTITLANTSAATDFTGILSPLVWVTHDDTVSLWEPGTPASPGLEALAEDGITDVLLGDLTGAAGVGMAGVADTPVGPGAMPGPLMPGDAYEFTVIPDATHRFLSLASMVVPSNDAFVGMSPVGVALMDAAGVPIPAAMVEASFGLIVLESGTEGNQAGVLGADMGPSDPPNVGPSNGSGLVREADEDEIWSIPEAQALVRVIVAPVEDR